MSGTRNTNIHSNHTVLSLDKHSGHDECQVSVKLDWPSNWRKCPLRFASRSYFVPIIVVWIKKLTRNTFYWLFKKGHIVHSNSIQLTVCNTIKTTHFIIPRYRAWTKLYILAWVRGSHKIQVHIMCSALDFTVAQWRQMNKEKVSLANRSRMGAEDIIAVFCTCFIYFSYRLTPRDRNWQLRKRRSTLEMDSAK